MFLDGIAMEDVHDSKCFPGVLEIIVVYSFSNRPMGHLKHGSKIDDAMRCDAIYFSKCTGRCDAMPFGFRNTRDDAMRWTSKEARGDAMRFGF